MVAGQATSPEPGTSGAVARAVSSRHSDRRGRSVGLESAGRQKPQAPGGGDLLLQAGAPCESDAGVYAHGQKCHARAPSVWTQVDATSAEVAALVDGAAS